MDKEQFEAKAVARYWFAEATEALTVAGHLMEKADYSYALFFAHLAIEKELKGLHAIRQGRHAPPIHNLVGLPTLWESNSTSDKPKRSFGSRRSTLRRGTLT